MSRQQESNTEFITRTAVKAARGVEGHVRRHSKRYVYSATAGTILTLLANAVTGRVQGGGHVTWDKFNDFKKDNEQAQLRLEKRVEDLETTNIVRSAVDRVLQEERANHE